MSNDFADRYRELENLNPLNGLIARSAHISANGIEWVDTSTQHLDSRMLEKFYYYMLLTRKTDEEIELFARKNIAVGKHLMSTGSEATAVGAGCAMGPMDWFAPAIRTLGAHLVRGITPYEVMCQVSAKRDGPTAGWDASLHFGSIEKKIVPLISHLGVMLPVVSGAAFAMKCKGSDGAAVAFSGDGATSVGSIHEALNIASIKELPLVFVVENNQWAFGTPNRLQFKCPSLALRALGYGRKVEGMLIDGTNVVTVYNTVRKALDKARRENVITFIEAMSMRMEGHSLADPFNRYVPERQLDAWGKRDPIIRTRNYLEEHRICSAAELDNIEKRAHEKVKEAARRVEQCASPNSDNIEDKVFVPVSEYKNAVATPPKDGRRITYHSAISEALRQEMEHDENVYIIGEDVGLSGGAFKITEGFSKLFDGIDWPEHSGNPVSLEQKRVIDAPLSETAFTLMAAGSTYEGLRPVVEFQFADFSSSAFMAIVNFIATQTARGFGPMPMVFRMPAGWTHAASAYHSINPESWFASTPGLKIVAPITSFDAKGMLLASIRDDNPVLFLEYKGYYRIKPERLPQELNTPVPEGDYTVPIGKARVLKEGNELTVVSYGSQVLRTLKAVHSVEKETGTSIEVIDLRTLIPWDKERVFESVKKTGKVLVTCEASETGCFGQTLTSQIGESCFAYLDAPVTLVAAADTPVPFAPCLEEAHLPTVEKLTSKIAELIEY